MPKSPLKACSSPGCPNLTSKGLCDRCKRKKGTTYEKRRRSAAKRGYDRRWRKARLHFLSKNPLCVLCLENDRIEPALIVDHIQPHRGDMRLFWDVNNWQALCKSCHDKKTIEETKERRRKQYDSNDQFRAI